MNLESPQTPGPELPPPLPPQPPAPPSEPREEPRSHGVERLLAAVRARQRRQLWLQGALLGTSTLLLLAVAGGFLALAAPAAGRWVLMLSPVAGTLVACAFGIWLSLRTVGDDVRTARLIGERRPELSLDVLAAVELSHEHGRDSQHSAELAEAFLRQMDLRAEQVDAGTVVDGTRLKHAGLVLGGVALVLAVVLGLAGAQWRVGLGKALESASQSATAEQREPITGDIELTYRYPAYTGLTQRTVPGTNGEVSAPAGTEVQLKTRSDREVERAELVVNGETLPLTVTGKRELAGTFVAKKTGNYHFLFYGTGRKPIATGPDIPLNVEADTPPQVQLLTPAAEIEIDPGQEVTLKYEATDDYGLNGLALVFRTPGAKEETRIPLPKEDGRRDKGLYKWNLGTLKVQPGDRISYYIEAKDNDAVEGPKRGVSRTQVLRVYSAAEHLRAALEKAEAIWGRMVDHLADRLEGPDRDKVKDAQKVASGQAVDTSGLTLVADMRALSQELGRERDNPAELVTALANISATLGQRVRATGDLRRIYLRTQQRRAGDDFGTGARLGALVDDEISELEKDILYLESLLDRQKLEALQELAKQLASERRELANLIEQYKQNPDEQVREQVMQQIQQVRNRINELMQRMAEMRQGIRDEHLNAEALQEMMKDQDMQSALDEVERLMREGKTDEALAKLQELSMQMDEMLNGLNEAQDQFGGEQFPELAQKFGQFMNDLEKTAQEQQRVADATKALRDQARQQNKDRLAERGKAMKDELQRQVEQVQKNYQQLRPDEISSRASRPLEEAQAELENVKNALKVDDYDLAAEAAQRASEAAQQLSSYGEQQRALDEMYGNPDDVRKQSAQLAEKLEKDAKSVEDVNRKLQSLFPPPGSQMSQQEKQQLQQLAQQQEELEEKAKGLRQQMQDMEQMAPLFGQEAGDQMEEIGRRMGEAAQRMQGKDANRGYGEQQAALEGIKQFQQQMKESQRGRGKGRGLPLPMGMGKSEGNGRDPRDKVEIPDEEAYQAPKEFRKDLLDAMKQGAPEKYRDQVKRYYEELVK
ncbi:DUF4175 family protein [Vitiosangium sp. GDMCC 1.1324]|uniref:DUF4175 family protein n=1 Tax=Vitiosangium sp. (strain GDMCC 1.1324) TaxID=2138576 RepID=UPI000D367840|nr:DUF4175 family protein [Vitiosangium sp. GDMCC 1.1324]PTL81380.1 DUF4175 domain-containing protein [Vitiosangium sp. GDMCC 1.1324]